MEYIIPTGVISLVISIIGFLLHRVFVKGFDDMATRLDKIADKVSDHDIKLAKLETIKELVEYGKISIR